VDTVMDLLGTHTYPACKAGAFVPYGVLLVTRYHLLSLLQKVEAHFTQLLGGQSHGTEQLVPQWWPM
jgi:hypothetical protein